MLRCSILLVLLGSSSWCWGSVAGQRGQGRRRQNQPRLLRIPASHDENKDKSSRTNADPSSSSLLELELELDSTYFSSRELAQGLSMSLSMSMSPCLVPRPFASEDEDATLDIHVILELGKGVFFEELIQGIEQQAAQVLAEDDETTQIQISVFDAQGNATAMAAQIVASASQETEGENYPAAGIITIDGNPAFTAALCASIVTANAAGIPVVSKNLDCDDPGEEGMPTAWVQTQQSNTAIAELVLTQAAQDTPVVVGPDGLPGPTPVGYVNDLARGASERNVVWETYRKNYQWEQEFFVDQAASYNTSDDLQNAISEQLIAATTSTTTIQFVYAPWDYLALTTVQALQYLDSNDDDNSQDIDFTTTKVYGADINTEDIEAMIAPQSPWLATAGGHPAMIGAAILRMNLLQLAQKAMTPITTKEFVQMPSFLFTQEMLRTEQVTNLDELLIAMPELRMQDIASVCWIEPL